MFSYEVLKIVRDPHPRHLTVKTETETEHSETKTTNANYGSYYAKQIEKKINIQPALLKILQYVDSNRKEFLNDLEEAVKIPSISGEMKYRSDVHKMIKFTEAWLTKLGVKYECFNIGFHVLEGKKVRLPPVILGTLGNDSKKKTLCVYGWLDVKHPVKKMWKTDPWVLTEVKNRLYGCGVPAGKGSLICWFNVVKAFRDSDTELPVNVKFIIESMHYQESEGLADFLALRKQDFLFNVDFVVVCDSEWIGDKYPCLTYGTVGLLHFRVTIEKKENSESEPKDDMVKIFERICDDKENILIANFHDFVQQISPDEEHLYEVLRDFDVEEIRDTLPEHKKTWNKIKLLMHFWRLPSILVSDIEECICEKQDKTKIKRHFVLKIVPRQIVEKATKLTLQHIFNVCKELKIDNKVDAELLSSSRPWVEDIRSPNYEAARRATIQIYKEDPNMIREDRDMKVVTILHTIVEKNLLLLPVGDKNINIGGDNENIHKKHYYEGIKLFAAYLFQLAYVADKDVLSSK